VWNTRDAAWEEAYDRLLRFAEREGHGRVPKAYRDEDGFGLGSWVDAQRQFSKRGGLSADRADRLEAVRGWVWNPMEGKWEEGYSHLLQFVEREAHSRVPQSYRDEDGYRLGNWVNVQRAFRRRGLLSKERIRLLEAVPGWVWDAVEARWEDAYARLVRFTRRERRGVPKISFREEDGFRLGVWVDTQRQSRRHGRLSEDRVRRLEALPGWVWRAGK
jgi:hypothetical protein